MKMWPRLPDLITDAPQILWRDLWIGTIGISLLLTVCYLTGLDFLLTEHYYNSTLQTFPLRFSPLYQGLLHDQLKKLPVLVALLLLAHLLYALFRRRHEAARHSGYLLLAMILGTGIISLLRAYSPVACPWDLIDYNGTLPFLEPYAFFQGGQGHCWPSGHASGGFCLVAFFFWLRAHGSRWAWLALAMALALGGVMGWAQIVRGAHFLSHIGWSLLLCWISTGALASWWWRKNPR